MAKEKKQLIIICSTPDGKNGRFTTFSRTLSSGKTEVFGVELNTPTDVTTRPWVYEIWENSYWNKNKKKNYSTVKVEGNELGTEQNDVCSREALYIN